MSNPQLMTAARERFDELYAHEVASIKERLGKNIDPEILMFFPRRTNASTPRPSLLLAERNMQALTSRRDREDANRVLNNFLWKICGIDEQEPVMQANLQSHVVELCSNAESFFVDVLRQLADGKAKGQYRVTVYHDDQGPVLLRKSYEAKSALSLEPLKLAKTTIPAGVICAVDSVVGNVESGECNVGNLEYRTIRLKNPPLIAPKRLTPWAYEDPITRASFGFWHHDMGGGLGELVVQSDPERMQLAADHSIDDFRNAASTIMTMCGVV